jgi:hypothetical protein
LTSTNVNLVKQTPISDIEYPVLFVHHKDDGCKPHQYRDALALSKTFKRSPRVDFISVEGGNEPKSGPCEALSAHGFFGIEIQVIDAISNWISDRQKENKKKGTLVLKQLDIGWPFLKKREMWRDTLKCFRTCVPLIALRQTR